MGKLLARMRRLYEDDSREAHRFRYGLLAFDVATILFIVATSFIPRTALISAIDLFIGFVLLAEFTTRFACRHQRMKVLAHPLAWAEIVALGSFLAPLAGEGAGFLRVLRTVRLLHTYRLLQRLRADSDFFRRNEEIILAATHLGVFIFIMTGLVYETQHTRRSPTTPMPSTSR